MKKKELRQNNKGFSLVELIIVMAIMAILVGAIAPQVISYVEKSRESKDLEVVDTVFTATQTAIAAEDSAPDSFTGTVEQAVAKFTKMGGILKADYRTVDGVKKKCKSKAGKNGILYVSYNADTGAISAYIGPDADVKNATIGPVTN